MYPNLKRCEPMRGRFITVSALQDNNTSAKAMLGNRKRDLHLISLHPSGHASCKVGPPRGLYNLGQTCYLNVILQMIAHNPLIRNFFLGNIHNPQKCVVSHCIACGLGNVLKALLTTTTTPGSLVYVPADFIYTSWFNIPVSIYS